LTLEPGKTLSHYRLLGKIGEGGMGMVYKAHDERLGRDVALKVLPAGAVAGDEARRRFRQEALALSRSSHPNIATIYDFDTENTAQGPIDFLVMEHLEGETLGNRLARGPLPIEQAVRTAIEIAGALDRAHQQGVIHRDLKPGNIMLTKSGAKVLDFGLAKLRGAAVPTATSTHSALPTAAQGPLTADGAILGTLQYMAPEQLEGGEADARSDLFALGSILFEMITGQRAFDGKSQATVIAAILEREPAALSAVQPATPAALETAVRHKKWEALIHRVVGCQHWLEQPLPLQNLDAKLWRVAPKPTTLASRKVSLQELLRGPPWLRLRRERMGHFPHCLSKCKCRS
jgi:serine/threonine protein kinase